MKKLLLTGVMVVPLLSTSTAAFACYGIARQDGNTVYLNCSNGGTAKVWYHSLDKVWHYGFASFTTDFKRAARYGISGKL